MDEENLFEVDTVDESSEDSHSSQEEKLTPEEQAIGRSPVTAFIDDFESNQSGDPFRLVQKFSREGVDIIADTSTNSGLQGLSLAGSSLFSHLSKRLIESAPIINSKDELKRNIAPSTRLSLSDQIEGYEQRRTGINSSSGLIARAGINDYRALLNKEGEFKGIFFQFQEQSIVSSLIERRESWSLITQRLSYAPGSNVSDRITTGQILAPNELTYSVGQTLAKQRGISSPVTGIRAFASFHPKVGYVGNNEKGYTAYLGTQNITPALSGNNSIETLMVFNRPGVSTALHNEIETAAGTESYIASEIIQLTNTIDNLAKSQSNFLYKPGAIRSELQRQGAQRGFMYVESEIYGRISGALNTAAFNKDSVKNKDQVVMSMGDISILLKTRGYATDLIASLTKLAREKRLVIVTDNHRMQRFFDELRNVKRTDPTKALGINEDFIRLLIDSGSLRNATTGYQHDKTIAIFGGSDRQLKFITTGSANLSADALIPVSKLGNAGDYTDSAVSVLRRTLKESEYDGDSPINAEVNLAIGFGRYRDDSRPQQALRSVGTEQYFQQLNKDQMLSGYYNTLSAGYLYENNLYKTGSLLHKHSSESQIDILRQKIEKLNLDLGGTVLQVEGVYDTSKSSIYGAKQVGLKVKVNGLYGSNVIVNLTVNREGNVVLTDNNKVITGSIFVNKSQSIKTIGGRDILPGKSANITGLDTAVGLLATLSREMSYQSRYETVDTIFNRIASNNPGRVTSSARQILADSISKLVPEISQSIASGQGRINLTTLMAAIKQHGQSLDVEKDTVLSLSKTALSVGITSPYSQYVTDLSQSVLAYREQLLSPVWSELSSGSEYAELLAGHRLVRDVLQLDKEGIFNDLKLAIILNSEEGRKEYSKVLSAQNRKLLSTLSEPFLAVHELGYSAYQAASRLPIYSESTTYGESSYEKLVDAGWLNPSLVKPGTRIGEVGEYFRPVGSVSSAKNMKVPGFGGIRSLSVIDSDLATGAAIAYNTDTMFQSTPGMAKITKQQYLKQVNIIRSKLGLIQESSSALEEEIQDTIYLLPFNKPEQIPQRLKNVMGGRPAIDISLSLDLMARTLQSPQLNTADDIVSGRVKEVLPNAQFLEVQNKLQELSSNTNQLQTYYRELELDSSTSYKGIIGPRSMKRVTLTGGASLIGDSFYVNAGYNQPIGNIHTVSVKVGSRQVTNQIDTINILSKYLAKGNILFSTPISVEDRHSIYDVINEIETKLITSGKKVNDDILQKELAEKDGGLYAHYLLKRDRGNLKVQIKEGLYSKQDDRYTLIGSFTHDGLIVVQDYSTTTETQWGKRRQPITIKFPGFGKRHQDGINVIVTTPHINVSDSGVIKATTDVVDIWRPNTGSRNVGSGLVKGTFSLIKSSLFEDIEKVSRLRTGLLPESVRKEQLYGLFGFSHFKGFNYESGLFLLSQKDTREQLMNVSGKNIARSLSLLFLGSKEIKSKLQENLLAEGLDVAASSLSSIKATDFTKSHLGKVAFSLSMLAEGEDAAKSLKAGDLTGVKKIVLKALSGDTKALTHLELQNRKLIQTAVEDPTSAIALSDGNAIFNESSLVARGAGLLSHLTFLGNQLFGRHSVGVSSVGNLFELNLNDPERYLTDIGYRNTVDAIASTTGVKLPNATQENYELISKKLKILQALLKNDFVLEDLKDMTTSKSLVPVGNKDEVAFEYQYMLGISANYMKAFGNIGGGSDKSKEIQKAFSTLVGINRLGLASPNAVVEYNIAFPGTGEGFVSEQTIEAQKMLLGYTSLADSIGLLETTIKGLSENNEDRLNLLNKFINLQKIATGVLGSNESQLESRAITLNRDYGLTYFGNTSSLSSRMQNSRLLAELRLNPSEGENFTPLQTVSKIVSEAYAEYAEFRQSRRSSHQTHLSFAEYAISMESNQSVRILEEKYQLIQQLTNDNYKIPGIKLSSEPREIYEKVYEKLERINQVSFNRIKETFDANVYKEFVTGALSIESKLKKIGDTSLLSQIQKTKQIVFPAISTSLIQTGDDEGRYRVNIHDPKYHQPSIGALLGTDVLSKISLIFPQHIDEALQYQLEIRKQLIETEQLRGKLFNNPGGTISEAEKLQLEEFTSTIENSRLSLVRLLDTDLVRKAMGDRMKFDGAVGFAVSNFSLSPGEVSLGSRFNSLVEGSSIPTLLENQFKLLRLAQTESSEQFQSFLGMTKQLLDGIPIRGDRSFVYKTLDSVKSGKESLDKLEVETYAAIAQVTPDKIANLRKNKKEFNERLSLALGSLRRGGAPAGAAALASEQNFYEVTHISNLQDRLKQQGSGLIPEENRFKTGMFAPAIGRLLSMLGDFDGDAYQFLLAKGTKSGSELTSIQQELLGLNKRLRKLEADFDYKNRLEPESIDDLMTEGNLSTEIGSLREEINTKQQELLQGFQQNVKYEELYNRNSLHALNDMRQWVGSYLALPEFITRSDASTGELMSYVQQLGGTMPQMQDAQKYYEQIEHRMEAIGSLFNEKDGFQFTEEAITASNKNLTSYVDRLLGSTANQNERDALRFDLQGIFKQASTKGIKTKDEFMELAQNYLSLGSNLSLALEQVNKSVKKAAGLMLNPMDFEGLTSLIGEAGTSLIGKTYNTLIPLLDQGMMEHSILTSYRSTGERAFGSIMSENLEQMKLERPEDAQTIEQLQSKLSSNELRSDLRDRFSGLTGTLASMQQLIRDALKEKGGGTLIDTLRSAGLVEKMENIDESDPLKADEQRISLLSDAVKSKLGPNLGFDPNSYLGEHGSRLRLGQDNDPGLSGFGALLRLAEYSLTTDQEKLYEKFVTQPQLEEAYQNKINSGEVGNVNEFAASQVLNLLERTQASFISSTYTDTARDSLVSHLRDFGQSDRSTLSDHDQSMFDLISKYETQRLTIDNNSEQINALNQRLLQEVTLSTIQHRNRVHKVLTIEHIKQLRENAIASQQIRFGDGDIFTRMQIANVDAYNSYTRILQRGQQPDMTDAFYLSGYKLDTLAHALKEQNVDVTTMPVSDQHRMAKLLGLNIGTGILDKDEQRLLVEGMLRKSDRGLTGLQALQETSAGISSGVFSLFDEMEALTKEGGDHNERLQSLREQLSGVMSDEGFNVDKLQQLGAIHTTPDTQAIVENVEHQMNRVISEPFGRSQREIAKKVGVSILAPDTRLETVGAFAAPVLMALAGSNMKFDERIGMFGIDVLQSVATISTDTERMAGKLAGSGSQTANHNFTVGRIKQSLETEGLVAGVAQGIIQETLFRTTSEFIYKGIDMAARKVPGGRTRAGSAIATVAAETLGTVVSLSTARGLTKQRTPDGMYLPDRVSEMVKSFSEQVWKMAQAAAEAVANPNFEAIDTDENTNLDIDITETMLGPSAQPNELEQSITSGLLVLDADDTPIASEFNNSNSEQIGLATGISRNS